MAARVTLVLAVLYTLLITALSLVQLGDLSVGHFSPTDKMLHAFAYFVLAFVWFFYYLMKKPQDFKGNAGYYKISLPVIAFGMLIEVLQGALTSYRQPDWADILANTGGVIIALLFFIFFKSFLIRVKHKISLFL